MLAHGFSIDLIVELINSGLAAVQTEWFVPAGCRGERAWVRITEAGRRALLPARRVVLEIEPRCAV
jgi:hypothetical protein